MVLPKLQRQFDGLQIIISSIWRQHADADVFLAELFQCCLTRVPVDQYSRTRNNSGSLCPCSRRSSLRAVKLWSVFDGSVGSPIRSW